MLIFFYIFKTLFYILIPPFSFISLLLAGVLFIHKPQILITIVKFWTFLALFVFSQLEEEKPNDNCKAIKVETTATITKNLPNVTLAPYLLVYANYILMSLWLNVSIPLLRSYIQQSETYDISQCQLLPYDNLMEFRRDLKITLWLMNTKWVSQNCSRKVIGLFSKVENKLFPSKVIPNSNHWSKYSDFIEDGKH